MVGGAWPLLVGEVICQVNSINERDPHTESSLLIIWPVVHFYLSLHIGDQEGPTYYYLGRSANMCFVSH